MVIEHTSVNPNKALHVGHMRNVILGDTLYRIMKATNHRATVLNYVDDSGLQVADIVIGFKFAGFPEEPPAGKKFDHYCGDDVYVKVNEMYERDPQLAEKRRQVLREIEEGKSEIARFAAGVTRRVLHEQLRLRVERRGRFVQDEDLRVRKEGARAHHVEGIQQGRWVLLDYVDFVVHIFHPSARVAFDAACGGQCKPDDSIRAPATGVITIVCSLNGHARPHLHVALRRAGP